jgi:hypothetical protein
MESTNGQILWQMAANSSGGSGSCTTGISFGNGNLLNDVNGSRLSKIETSTEVINFISNSNRLDVIPYGTTNTAKYLNEIQILPKNNSNSVFCKSFILEHDYWETPTPGPISSNWKRLKLNKITENNCSINPSSTTAIPSYIFDYEGTNTSLPHRFSREIDHWGFYNAQSANETIGALNIPPLPAGFPGLGSPSSPQPNSNRNSNETAMKLGVLKKITYPTGGKTELIYEANKGSILEASTVFTNASPVPFNYSNNLTGLALVPTGKIRYSKNIIFSQGEIEQGYILFEFESKTATTHTANLYLKDANDVVLTNLSISTDNQSQIITKQLSTVIGLQAGQVYTYFIVINYGGSFSPVGTFYCQFKGYEEQTNQIVGGLRIKKIRLVVS